MTNCEGCDARDEMIRTLSRRIDELEGNDVVLEIPDLPTTPELVEYVRQIQLGN